MPKKLELTYHGRVLSKKNSKRIITNHHTRKPMMVSNRSAQENEADMTGQFYSQFVGRATIGDRCSVEITIFEPNFQRRDLDNQATSILDALVKAGVLKDDSFKLVTKLSVKFGGVDRDDPRAEILIATEN